MTQIHTSQNSGGFWYAWNGEKPFSGPHFTGAFATESEAIAATVRSLVRAEVATAIWRAQGSLAIGSDNAQKRAMRAGIKRAAEHVASELIDRLAIAPNNRAAFIKACGFPEQTA